MGVGIRTWLVVAILASSVVADGETFDFVALGDTAYTLPRDLPIYEKLIAAINDAEPAFSIHVGDTWGALVCTEDNHRWVREWFGKFDHPVIYTPGDNEWTDCREPEILEAYLRIISGEGLPEDFALIGHITQLDQAYAGAGYADTLASLSTIRQVFFAEPKSVGARPMPLDRQPDLSDFEETLENVRWSRGGVHFVTVNVPGSSMGFTINDANRAQEAISRNRANLAWLKNAFERAISENAAALVVAMHASMFADGPGTEAFGKPLRGGELGPYYWIALAVRDLAAAFGRPVLLIHGDEHEFIVDRPFLVSQGESQPPKYSNVTRLQVYGAPELKAVRVSVDTGVPWVFGFEPLYPP